MRNTACHALQIRGLFVKRTSPASAKMCDLLSWPLSILPEVEFLLRPAFDSQLLWNLFSYQFVVHSFQIMTAWTCFGKGVQRLPLSDAAPYSENAVELGIAWPECADRSQTVHKITKYEAIHRCKRRRRRSVYFQIESYGDSLFFA